MSCSGEDEILAVQEGVKTNEKQMNLSLQTHQYMFSPEHETTSDLGRISLGISWEKASLTVEAAASLFFFFVAMVLLISIIDMVRVKSLVTVSLNESAKKLAVYAYGAEKGGLGDQKQPLSRGMGKAGVIAYSQAHLPQIKRIKVSLLASSYKNHYVDLKAQVRYLFPVRLGPIGETDFWCRARVHAWTGYEKGEGKPVSDLQEEMVYVTDGGEVYHTHSDCTYLKLSVRIVRGEELKNQRNAYGGKYYPCAHCKPKGSAGSFYVTEEGASYHSDPSCSALTRTGHLVRKSQVKGKCLCSRCAGSD